MRELKLVEPPDINSLYNGLLLEGEKFWSHDFRTLNEILDCLNVVKVTNRLPSCFWERKKHWRRMGIDGTSLNDSTKVKLINKGSITFVSPFFANAMLYAVFLI